MFCVLPDRQPQVQQSFCSWNKTKKENCCYQDHVDNVKMLASRHLSINHTRSDIITNNGNGITEKHPQFDHWTKEKENSFEFHSNGAIPLYIRFMHLVKSVRESAVGLYFCVFVCRFSKNNCGGWIWTTVKNTQN